MGSDSIGMLIAIVILVAMSAYFSATETAFTSLNRIRLLSRMRLREVKADSVAEK